MAVEHVKIDEVHEAQAREVLRHRAQQRVDAVGVVFCAHGLRDAAPVKNIGDLADRIYRFPAGLQPVEHRFAGRRQRVVVPVCRAREAPRRARERPCDHAADREPAREHRPRRRADLIELGERHDVLMRRDLEHAVRRGVYNQLPRFHVLFAVVRDHRRARIRAVAQHAAAHSRRKALEERGREAPRERGQRLLADDARDLPVADRRILAVRFLREPRKCGGRRVRPFSARHAVYVEKPERAEVWQRKARAFRTAQKRVAARVAEARRVRHLPDADAVEYN